MSDPIGASRVMKGSWQITGELLSLQIEAKRGMSADGVFVQVFHVESDSPRLQLVGQFFLHSDEAVAFADNLMAAARFLVGGKDA